MDITILSVNCDSYEYLNRNIVLFTQVNPSIELDWHVIDTSPNKQDSYLDQRFKYHRDERFCKYDVKNHGLGLTELVKRIKTKDLTKIILFLDPDFLLTEPIDNILNRMNTDYAFDGAEYRPGSKSIMKFPTVFCMFVNTELVDIDTLDCRTPPIGEKRSSYKEDTGFYIMWKYHKSKLKYHYYSSQSRDLNPPELYLSDIYNGLGIHFRQDIWKNGSKEKSINSIKYIDQYILKGYDAKPISNNLDTEPAKAA